MYTERFRVHTHRQVIVSVVPKTRHCLENVRRG